MNQDECDSWTNMLLLCDEHHGEVDAIEHESEYSVAALRQWKDDREVGLVGDLPQLRGISDLDLQQMLVRQVDSILNFIDSLQGVSREAIDEIKDLVERQFTGDAIDADAIALRAGTSVLLSADMTGAPPAMGRGQHTGIIDFKRFWPYLATTFAAGLLIGAAIIGALWASAA